MTADEGQTGVGQTGEGQTAGEGQTGGGQTDRWRGILTWAMRQREDAVDGCREKRRKRVRRRR